MRNPKLEVYEAGLVVLGYADADFASDLLQKIGNPAFEIGHIRDRLIWGIEHKNGKEISPEQLQLLGFTSANIAYDARLLEEWREFLSGMVSYDITVIARTNKVNADYYTATSDCQ